MSSGRQTSFPFCSQPKGAQPLERYPFSPFLCFDNDEKHSINKSRMSPVLLLLFFFQFVQKLFLCFDRAEERTRFLAFAIDDLAKINSDIGRHWFGFQRDTNNGWSTKVVPIITRLLVRLLLVRRVAKPPKEHRH
jgi:hypothetical protein